MTTATQSFHSGSFKYGMWVPEAEIEACAIASNSTIDFSRALFAHPVIAIRAKAITSSLTIVVPPGVRVEKEGKAILGDFGSGKRRFYQQERVTRSVTPGEEYNVRLTTKDGGFGLVVCKSTNMIKQVHKGSAAEECGLQPGDIIVAVDGEVLGPRHIHELVHGRDDIELRVKAADNIVIRVMGKAVAGSVKIRVDSNAMPPDLVTPAEAARIIEDTERALREFRKKTIEQDQTERRILHAIAHPRSAPQPASQTLTPSLVVQGIPVHEVPEVSKKHASSSKASL